MPASTARPPCCCRRCAPLRWTPRTGPRHAAAGTPLGAGVAAVDGAGRVAGSRGRACRVRRAGRGVRYGASVGYLAQLAAFARDLVARGRVVPALGRDEHGPVACWRPVLPGARCRRHELAGRGDAAGLPGGAGRARRVRAGHVGPAGDGRRRRAGGAAGGHRPRAAAAGPSAEAAACGRGVAVALTAPDGRFEADPEEAAALVGRCGRGRTSGPGSARPGRCSAWPRSSRRRPMPSGRAVAAGVPAAVHRRPEPARAGRAGMGRRRQPAPLAGPPAGTAAGRARPGQPGLPRAGRRPARGGPSGLDLDADGAYDFLSAAAPPLDEAGFGVLLPSWWDRRRKLGLALSAYTPVDGVVAKASKFGRDQLVDFRWELAVGDDTLTEEEIAALAAAKAPLVRLRGQWVAVDRSSCAAAWSSSRASRPGQDRRRDPGAGRQPSRRPRHAAASSPRSAPTAGWATCSAVPPRSRCSRSCRRMGSAALRPYQQRGLSWLAFLSSLGLGAAWPTTWGWARPCSCSPWRRCTATSDRAPGRRCCCARCRWSATGSGRPPGSRPACGCTRTTGRRGCAARRWATGWRRRPHRHHLRHGDP